MHACESTHAYLEKLASSESMHAMHACESTHAHLEKLDQSESVGRRQKHGAELAILAKEGCQLVLRDTDAQVLDEDEGLRTLYSASRNRRAPLARVKCSLQSLERNSMLCKPRGRLLYDVALSLCKPDGQRRGRVRVQEVGLADTIPLSHCVADSVRPHEETVPVGRVGRLGLALYFLLALVGGGTIRGGAYMNETRGA